MLVLEQAGFGGNEHLAVAERDEPMLDRPDAVRVAVSAAGLSRWDLQRRRGLFGGGRTPLVPGYQGCGVIEASGPAVAQLRPGDRVWWAAADPFSANGACAEIRVVDAAQLLAMPEGLDDFTAASAPLALAVAMPAIELILRQGRPRRVLIHDAASDVGFLVLQLAELATLRVAALVRNEEQRQILGDSGVDLVLLDDSLDTAPALDDWSEGVGSDVMLCCGQAAGAVDWLSHLAIGGRCLVCSPDEPVGAWRTLNERGLSLSVCNPLLATDEARRRRRQALEEGGELLAQGRVELPVTRMFAMNQATEAFEYLEREVATGGVILDINA